MRRRVVPSDKDKKEEEILDPAQQDEIVATLIEEALHAQVIFSHVARAVLILTSLFLVIFLRSPLPLLLLSTTSLLLAAAHPLLPLPPLLPLALAALVALAGLYLERHLWLVPLGAVGVATAMRYTGQSTVDEARKLGELRYNAPEA
ncbi:hypothetical protein RQP46_002913 [Phenoliferia psychrophenolica]